MVAQETEGRMSYHERDIKDIKRRHGRTSTALPPNTRIYETPEIKAARLEYSTLDNREVGRTSGTPSTWFSSLTGEDAVPLSLSARKRPFLGLTFQSRRADPIILWRPGDSRIVMRQGW